MLHDFLLAAVLAVSPSSAAPQGHHEDASEWTEVQVSVVDELAIPNGSWLQADEQPLRAEHFTTKVTRNNSYTTISVSDSNGLLGDSVWLRFAATPEGELRAWAQGYQHSDLSGLLGPHRDLVGAVQLAHRPAGSTEPLRIAFVLTGFRESFLGLPQPLLLRGAIKVDPSELKGLPAIQSPLPIPQAFEVKSDTLVPTILKWDDGMPRAFGQVDSFGRRQGEWTTWYANGVRQSVTTFVDGLRHGEWRSFDGTGQPFLSGSLDHGIQSGLWTEERLDPTGTIARGNYRNGQKHGTWSKSNRESDALLEQGTYDQNRQVGEWTWWWPNGQLRERGPYNTKGYADGTFERWLEDGTPAEPIKRKPPPWGRKDQ